MINSRLTDPRGGEDEGSEEADPRGGDVGAPETAEDEGVSGGDLSHDRSCFPPLGR